jgi:chromosome segregation ATPase
VALLAVLALGGCALQSEVMEIDEEMGAVQALQKELERGIADANEAAETMRAIGVRMAAVEDRLKAEVRPELEARITKGMDDLERALEAVARSREANEARIREAETFFVERLEKLSSRQQALSTRITAMEAEGAPSSPRARAARAELTADLETLRGKVRESSEALVRVQEQFNLLTDTVAGLAESQQLARQQRAGVTEQAAERLDLRLSNLEARAADAAAGQERLAQEIGLLTDRLAALSTAKDEAAQQNAALANDAAAALAARLDALERSEAERAKREAERAAAAQAQARAQAEANTRLAARLDELTARTDALAAARTQAEAERAALSEDAAGQLAAQMDALRAQDAAGVQARQRLQEQVTGLADRLAGLSAGQAADQAERAALSADAAGRLEARVAAVEAANARAADRTAALERQDNAAAAERQQLALQVSAAADAASRPPQAVQAALADLDRRVAEMEGGSGRIQRLAELTDQLGVLGSQVTERLDAQASDFTRLAARLDRLQEGVEGFQAAPPPWGEALDQKVTFLADEVAPRVDTQNRELAAIADTVAAGRERNDLEIARANERVNALGTSLVERIEGLEGRVARAEQSAGAASGAPIDAAGREEVEALSRRVDVLGREVPARVDRLTDLVGQLRDHLERVGERIALLETIQKEESNDLRERFNALSSALSELERGAP